MKKIIINSISNTQKRDLFFQSLKSNPMNNLKIFSFLSFAALGFAILITGCKKDQPTTIDDAAALTDFFERNVVPSQTFTIDNAAGGTATTAKGTRITFPPNCFIGANGGGITGNVNIEFKELVDKVDFVLSNKGTVADGLPLETGGSWMIKATQANAELRINPAAPIKMNIKREDTVDQLKMNLFNANPNGNKNGGAINWGAPRQVPIIPLSTPFNNFFCNLDSVGWGNADRFMTNPVYANNTRVVANNGTNLTNFSAMFIYKGKKIVWPLSGRNAGEVTDSHTAKNQIGHIVVFGYLNGVFTTGILQDQTITSDGQVFTVTLTTNTEAAFKATLSSILI